ncbi:MAG: sigma-70 family RNA polymerase sigma factor [Deltaproteobacteria bacterium]|nr:sigma-70 family RNA polymerase sigma factor [Deltaproteobacteria bacterium]
MTLADPADVTDLLVRVRAGDPRSAEQLFQATYEDLRDLARQRLRNARRNTLLDTTGLVHEWYVRFAAARHLQLEDRKHFLRYAGRAMRNIIVDFARRRSAERRGGPHERETLGENTPAVDESDEKLLIVHEALDELAKLSPRMAEVVTMRYFAGLTDAEIGEALEVTERTARRDWVKARLWLAKALE